MAKFYDKFSVRIKIFFAVVISFFIALGIAITQFNMVTELQKNRKYLYRINLLTEKLYSIRVKNSDFNSTVLEIVKADNKDEFLNAKHRYKNLKSQILDDYNQVEHMDLKDLQISNVEDTLLLFSSDFKEKVVLISDKIVDLKTKVINPEIIAENYKVLLANEQQIGTIPPDFNINTQSQNQAVDKLINIYNYTIDYQYNFLRKELEKQSTGISNIIKELENDIKKVNEQIIKGQKRIKIYSIVLFLIGLIIILLLADFISRRFQNALFQLNLVVEKVSKGELIERSGIESEDEIGFIASSMDDLLKYLSESIKFSQEIVEGNFDYMYKPISDDDKLGNSLVQLQQYLKQAKIEEERREKEDYKRRRESEAVSLFSEILRQNQNNIKALASQIISNLVKFFKANQGMFFVLEEDENKKKYLDLKATYAWNREKYFKKRIEVGDGLIGSVAEEKFTVYMTNVPEDYIEIKSGIGGANPTSILLVPIKVDEDVLGVLEIASFNEFETYEIQIIETIAEDIASTLKSVKISQQTAELLEKFQLQTEEMRIREQELKNTIDELNKNYHEKKRVSEELSKKMKEIEELNKQILSKDEQLRKEIKRLEKENAEKTKRIEKSMERLITLINNMHIGVMYVDGEGIINDVNNAVVNFLEYDREEIKGRLISKFIVEPADLEGKKLAEYLFEKRDKINKDGGTTFSAITKSAKKKKFKLKIVVLDENKKEMFLLFDNIELMSNVSTANTEELNKLYEKTFYMILKEQELEDYLIKNNLQVPEYKFDKNEIIKWSKKYELGITLIDKQHQKWFQFINKLFVALIEKYDAAETSAILQELLNYTEYHFGFEERYFEEFGYENKEKHEEKHREFIETLKKVTEDYLSSEVVIFKLILYLMEWVQQHVLVEDRKYRDFFIKNGLK